MINCEILPYVNINIHLEDYTKHSEVPNRFNVFLLEWYLVYVTGFLLIFRVSPRTWEPRVVVIS